MNDTLTISREDLINKICKSDKYTREGVEQVLNTDGVLAVIEAVVLDAATNQSRASYWHDAYCEVKEYLDTECGW